MSILLGDIGGTRSRLEIRTRDTLIAYKVYSSKDYVSLSSLLQTFLLDVGHLDDQQSPSAFILAIAGPIIEENKNQCVKVTNLSWFCSAKNICDEFKIKTV